MPIKHNEKFEYGYNIITQENGDYSEMMMDFGILKMKKDQHETIINVNKEIAILLIKGNIEIEYNKTKKIVNRNSCFDEGPTALHVCKNTKITIKAFDESEIIVQKTTNNKDFPAKFYLPSDCPTNVFGDNTMNQTARRFVRVIFDYYNAPYSNMVLGELINFPGKWSSFPAHEHPQPEIYYYKFNKKDGFGCSVIGDDVYKVKEGTAAMLPGGKFHPQVSAPGYAMYYCWMIRHFEGNPWANIRNFEKSHEWLNSKDAVIWPDKK